MAGPGDAACTAVGVDDLPAGVSTARRDRETGRTRLVAQEKAIAASGLAARRDQLHHVLLVGEEPPLRASAPTGDALCRHADRGSFWAGASLLILLILLGLAV